SSERSRTVYLYDSHGQPLSTYTDGSGLTSSYTYDGLGRIKTTSELTAGPNLLTNPDSSSMWAPTNSTSIASGGTLDGAPATSIGVVAAGAAGGVSYDVYPVTSGDRLTFTVAIRANGTNTATFAIGGLSSWLGSAADATATISGPGTLSQNATAFQVSGLSTTDVTYLTITRTFTTSENARLYTWVGSGVSGTAAAGSYILVSKPSLTRLVTTTSTTASYTDGPVQGDNLYTGTNVASYWGTSNLNPLGDGGTIGGVPAFVMTATGGGQSGVSNYAHQVSVAAGETMSFTVSLKAGSINNGVVGMMGSVQAYGADSESTFTIVSGPGTIAYRSGSAFAISGLSSTEVTVVRLTRTFTSAQSVAVRVNVGQQPVTQPSGDSIVFANPILARTVGSAATAVTLANGLVQTSTYDRAGNLIAYAESGSGMITATTTYRYDRLGRVRAVTDPTGRSAYTFYDGDGRKTATVDADGSATEYRYDAVGRLTSMTGYATRLTATQLGMIVASGVPTDVAFASLRPASSADDRWSWNYYDAAGHLIRTIDGTGAVTVLAYDGAGQLVSTTQMANRMASADVAALKATTAPANLYTSPTSSSLWSAANATFDPNGTINGVNAYKLTASTTNTQAIAGTATQQIAVVAGDRLSFTITVEKGSCDASNIILLGSASGAGANGDSKIEVISGPGAASQIGGGSFSISGLSDTTPTIVRITRTFAQSENVTAQVLVGSNPIDATAGQSIVLSNPSITKTAGPAEIGGDLSGWTLGFVSRDPSGTIEGATAYAIAPTRTAPGALGSPGGWMAIAAGSTVSWTIKLQGLGASRADLSFQSSITVGGDEGDSMLEIVSGPGTITRIGTGSAWAITGLSSSTATTVRITRKFTIAESFGTYLWPGGSASGVTTASSIKAAASDLRIYAQSVPLLPVLDVVGDRVDRLFYDGSGRLLGRLDGEGYVSRVVYDG
ncbi:MAG: RHS repeat protein, partial [Novosphingobium sp.]|nr:RHS repeat protein [Novosphingobium sp.]